jgi:hypothetical protein
MKYQQTDREEQTYRQTESNCKVLAANFRLVQFDSSDPSFNKCDVEKTEKGRKMNETERKTERERGRNLGRERK